MAKNDERTEIEGVRNIKPQAGKAAAPASPDTIIYRPAKADTPAPAAAAPAPAADTDRTVIHRHAGEDAEPEMPEAGAAAGSPAPSGATAKGPVVGWLVVTEGPGRGQAIGFFEGMNSVGRDATQRVSLDFGDKEISREGHFFVTFEPKKRTFHLNHGGRTNLVYHNGDVLLAPIVLNKGDMIEVGQTKLMFVPLCGPDFSWDA